ncbi:MAG: TonB-dependent receptor [Candidatus Eisenbacteria bacterium]|nr:TonB-dependent receptor [Candidatus Eisenbacteria bacterium]
MECWKKGGRRFAATLALACFATTALAGTTGKIAGVITNEKKEPLTGVNVIVIGQHLGGMSDDQGRFTIINVPAGVFDVKAAVLGYAPTTIQGVEVNADATTRLDIALKEQAVAIEGVVVSARRPIIETNRTSNIATVSRQKLESLPVQELQDIVNLQAGVVDGHFRGGRVGEVQYQVDGVSVNNAYDNKSTLRLDRSILEEVQVISGTFDAEYGQAMSGVVNAVLRRGGEKFHWDAEVYSGQPVYAGSAGRIVAPGLRPASQLSFQASADGPTFLPHTTYLLSARRFLDDGWIRGERRFVPTDTIFHRPYAGSSVDSVRRADPHGDGGEVALGTSREWSGVVKLSNSSIRNVALHWQGILNVTDTRQANWAYRLDPDGLRKQHTLSLVQGMDLTHTLTANRFYTLSVRQNYKDYSDYAYESVWDPRYDAAGAPFALNSEYEDGALIGGVDLGRFVQRTNGVVLKGSFVDQVTKERQLKIGGEFQAPHVRFGAPGYLSFFADSLNAAQTIHRVVDYSPRFPGVIEYRPFLGAAFAQEEIEWRDLTLRAGARVDYFDARASLPSDLANPANSITGVPQSHPRRVTPKVSVSPRIGVSFPISDGASLFFAYGHFSQFPGIGDVFTNADYRQLSDLQATSPIVTMGNPDIRPERTVQYQFGWKQAVNENLGVDVTAFYKDIRDLLGTKILETYNGARYAQLSNVDFGSVTGVTVTLTRRALGPLSATLDYTWQSAQGNSSDPNETADRVAAGEDAEPRSVPFNWDQRHTLNLTTVLSKPGDYSLSAILRVQSGQPYTPVLSAGFSGGLETNSGRKPVSMLADLRGEKSMSLFGTRVRWFGRVFNLFDTRFFNGFVFTSSGDPYYTRFPVKDKATLDDPTRFYGPRRVEVGLSLNVAK